jgi:tetratricopeptide (TPR) repeat protein/TolA-binding protein
MMQRLFLSTAIVLGLAACASTEKAETLGELGELDIKIDTSAPITGARDKAMDNYWEFMAGAKQDNQKAEALRRLADLEMERSDERFQKQMEVLSAASSDTDVKALKEVTYRGAIKLYEDALKAAGGSGQIHIDVLYQLSKAYEQAGQPEKALDALNRLLAVAPDAPNRDELHFRRGEMLFDLRKFKQAELAYSQVMLVDANSRYFEKALTKRGWSSFKQGKYQQALNSFLNLIDRKLKVNTRGHMGKVALSRGDKELVDDVFRVVILSFDELGGAKGIKDYFAGYGYRDYEIRVYQQLGEFYVEKERIRDAAETYSAFSANYPMHKQAFEFDLKAIDTYTAAGFASLLIDAKREFVKRYRVKGKYWTRYQEHEDTVLAKLKPALQKNSEDVARHLHAEAQKSKSLADYQQAFLWYRQHLRWFGQSNNAQKLNFLYAELLFEADMFEQAAKEYEKTAYRYVRFGKDAEAGYAALLSYAEQEKRAEGKQKEVWSRLTVASALRFGKTFPNDSRAAGVLTKAAQDMFALNRYDQAAVAARQILELSQDATADTRRTAWKIIARAEFEKGDYTRAEVAYKVALSLTEENDSDRTDLENGLAAAVYKQGEYMRSKGNLQAAINQFSRVAEVSPDSKITVAADFDIAASMMAAKNWDEAIKAFAAFREANPSHPLAERVPDNLVKAYLETGQSLKAAEELERLAASKKDPEIGRAAIWQAAELYEKAGNENQVVMIYKKYIGMFPEPLEQATEARNKLAAIYARAGNEEQQRYWLKEIVRRDRDAGKQSTPRTRYLAAKAAYSLAQPVLRSFQQVKLVEPLKQNLKLKKSKMQAAVDAYTLAADYGVEEVATASVYWLAEIYNEFGRELMASERPAGLSEEELEQYDILLEEQAYPFEEKSINIHETNISRTAEGTYDEWVRKSFDKLKKLNPIRYSKLEKSESFAQLIY